LEVIENPIGFVPTAKDELINNNKRINMKIIKHGESITFICPDCGCEFKELPMNCYSSLGEDGAHYCAVCPECTTTCWTNDNKQQKENKMANFDIQMLVNIAGMVEECLKKGILVRVVRCKDCKHRRLCEKLIGRKVTDDNWYCADGERKEE
jgi:hypothetical protein